MDEHLKLALDGSEVIHQPGDEFPPVCVCVSVFYHRFAQSQGVGKRASATGA